MPVSGLVLTIDVSLTKRGEAYAALDADARFTRGPEQGPRLPVVCETDTVDGHTEALERLEDLPGVLMVELAYSDFSDVDEIDRLPPRRRRRSPPPIPGA